MDFRLTEDQIMMRTMVREFAQNEVKPVAMGLDAQKNPKDCIPWELIKKASKLGLRTLSIPEKYGGGGADYTTLAIVLEELGAADDHQAGRVGRRLDGRRDRLRRACSSGGRGRRGSLIRSRSRRHLERRGTASEVTVKPAADAHRQGTRRFLSFDREPVIGIGHGIGSDVYITAQP